MKQLNHDTSKVGISQIGTHEWLLYGIETVHVKRSLVTVERTEHRYLQTAEEQFYRWLVLIGTRELGRWQTCGDALAQGFSFASGRQRL